MPEQTTFVRAGGHRARLLDVGEGDPAVVLHGWGGRIESVTPVIACLRPVRRVLAFDLPGFGESPLPDGLWGTLDYAMFLRDALASLGVESADFVGHSYGAKTSLYLAATDSSVVRKIVAAGSSGLRVPPSLGVRLKRAASRGARASGALGPPGRHFRDLVYSKIGSRDYRE